LILLGSYADIYFKRGFSFVEKGGGESVRGIELSRKKSDGIKAFLTEY